MNQFEPRQFTLPVEDTDLPTSGGDHWSPRSSTAVRLRSSGVHVHVASLDQCSHGIQIPLRRKGDQYSAKPQGRHRWPARWIRQGLAMPFAPL
ncbi:hypothetical protein [Kibdelosporangium philippinense]|uniref:hypothetical protein n=1 Tax=Kibdelosporangium philippinense TaxID=211113 RepID=UPI003606EE65